MLHSELLKKIPGLVHGFGMRGIALDEYLRTLRLEQSVTFNTNQTHGNRVHHLHKISGSGVLHGDAFMTDQPGVVCSVRTADCVPIIIADTKRCAIAAVHAGWRGTAADVAGETLREMNNAFGTYPADCIAAIGPRICGRCYEVGEEVIKGIEAQKIGNGWRLDENRIDLGSANEALLVRAGILRSNMEMLPHCTRCDESFASYRRDHSDSDRQVNFIVIRDGTA